MLDGKLVKNEDDTYRIDFDSSMISKQISHQQQLEFRNR